jgi:transposase
MMTRTATNEKKRQRVFALREKGLSYAKIAKTVDMSVPTVGLWVRNAGMLSAKKLKAAKKANSSIFSYKPTNRALKTLKEKYGNIRTVSNASNTILYAKKTLEAFEALIREIS